jgi:hypothetical protein
LSYASGSADIIATSSAGFLLQRIGGPRVAIPACYTIAAIGSILICLWGYNASSNVALPLLVLFSKLGISGAFNICYLSNALLFPTLFTASSMGICNIFARTASIFSPKISEIDGTFPLWVVFAFSCLALVAGLFIKKPENL